MDRPVHRVTSAVLIIVLLALCIVVPVQLFHQAGLKNAIASTAYNLEVARARLQKQQQEYDEALAALPLAEADAQDLTPQADAIYAREQELRTQRKTLRAENAALSDELAALQTQIDAATEDTDSINVAILHLMDALDTLRKLPE